MDLSFLTNFIVPIIIFVISIGAAIIISIILRFVAKHASKTKSTLDDQIINAIRNPIFLAIISIGAYVALKYYNPGLAVRGVSITFIFTILWIIIVAFFVARILKGFFNWYVDDIHKTRGKTDNTIFRFLRRILILVVYLIALMIILDKAGIEISPLLAGLGIAGLAVALALEDTLKNFFSAIYIAADKPVKIGDYIEIDDSTKGYVQDVGWRSTTIKTMGNNFIVIPNNTLAQSVIKNYNDPQRQMSVLVNCGVAYSSDLEKVEKITIATAKKVLKKAEQGVSDYEPLFRFKEFGDSSINFYVILRAKQYEDQYALRHEFIKELFKAFNKNKIEIPFPQQDIYIKQMKKK